MSKFLKITTFIAMLILISSCAYYNTLFNAEELFKQAEERELDARGKASRQAREEYNKVIKKCGRLLEFYPDSKYVDDAIYLMAQSLRKKGGNKVKVIEQCDKIIQFFPDSEFYIDAVTLKAEVKLSMKKDGEAYGLLEELLLNPKYSEGKSKVLLKIAEFYTKQERYERARYYLARIIDEDGDSDEAKSASYFLGVNFFAEEQYSLAIDSFKKFNKQKNKREIEYDSHYYIALSYYELGEYKRSIKELNWLLDKDYRKKEKGMAKVLKGRNLLVYDKIESGIELLNEAISEHSRGVIKAEANYYLADYYLTNTDSLRLAIKLFNQVKSADNKSEHIDAALAKSSVASQILLFSNNDSDLEPQEIITEQFKLAEYYLEIMELPDSALAVYEDIILNKNQLVIKLDTLKLELDSLQIASDSLESVQTALLSEIDSLRKAVSFINTKDDTLAVKQDSLEIVDKVEDMEVADSLVNDSGKLLLTLEAEQDTLNNEVDLLKRDLQSKVANIENMESVLSEYNNEFIPFSYFVQAIIYNDYFQDSLQVAYLSNILMEDYPESKYTFALSRMKRGENVDLTTRQSLRSKKLYSNALNLFEVDNDSTITLLESCLDSLQTEELLKAQMTLGFLYYIDRQDTISAKVYFDTLLVNEEVTDEQKDWVGVYYLNERFIKLDSLPYLEELSRLKEERENEPAKDSSKDDKGKDEDKEKPVKDKKSDSEKEKRDKEKELFNQELTPGTKVDK